MNKYLFIYLLQLSSQIIHAWQLIDGELITIDLWDPEYAQNMGVKQASARGDLYIGKHHGKMFVRQSPTQRWIGVKYVWSLVVKKKFGGEKKSLVVKYNETLHEYYYTTHETL